MEIQIHSQSKKPLHSVPLSETVFCANYNTDLVRQALDKWFAGARQGSKAQKTRSEVRGGGIKPWRQKGTGRARAGTICSPIWRTGGVTFAAKPRDYTKKMNKKMYKAAMRCIFSELLREQRLLIVDSLELAAPKTRLFAELMQQLEVKHGLFVTDTENNTLALAARNIPNIAVLAAHELNPAALVHYDMTVMTESCLAAIQHEASGYA